MQKVVDEGDPLPKIMHMLRAIKTILFTSLGLVIISCERTDDLEIMAKVGDRIITVESFKRAYQPVLLYTEKTDSPETRAEIMNYLAGQKMLALEAEQLLLDTLSLLETVERTTEKSIMTRLLHQRWVEEQMPDISESEIREGYRRSQEQRLVRHLFSPDSLQLDSLYQILQADPRAFDRLAEEIFTDTSLQRNGGVLGWMSFGDMEREFENAAYALDPGDVSRPVQTRFGYHLIRVDNVMRQSMITESDYQLAREKIRRITRQRNEDEISREIIVDYMDSAELEFHPELATRVWDLINARVNDLLGDRELEELGESVELGSLEDQLADYRSEVMLTFRGDSWTVADFLERLPEMNRQLLVSDLKQGTAFLVRDELLLAEGRREGLHLLPEVQQEIADRRDQFLATVYLQQRSMDMTLDTSELREFHRQYGSTYYLEADSLYLQEISLGDSSRMQDILARLQSGEAFTELMHESTGAEGNLGWHHPAAPVNVLYYDGLVDVPVKTVLGPFRMNDRWVLIRALHRRRSIMPYELVQARVENDLVEDRLRKLRFRETQRLAEKYSVEIDAVMLNELDLGKSPDN